MHKKFIIQINYTMDIYLDLIFTSLTLLYGFLFCCGNCGCLLTIDDDEQDRRQSTELELLELAEEVAAKYKKIYN